MDVREKLVELLGEVQETGVNEIPAGFGCTRQYITNEIITAHLISHGVTVQEWIPVTERLPEESGMYIITANDGHAQRVSFVQWQKKNRIWNLTGARSYWRVTHWMPMPQPPKGE